VKVDGNIKTTSFFEVKLLKCPFGKKKLIKKLPRKTTSFFSEKKLKNSESPCVHGTKALLFYASIWLVALGGGGIRGSVPTLGADQFDKDPEERKLIATFFKFSISMSCAFVGLVCLALGKPLILNILFIRP
jgi:dipeptide/tripeptide permease